MNHYCWVGNNSGRKLNKFGKTLKTMKTYNVVKKLALGAALCGLVALNASAIIAYNNTGVVQNQSTDGPYALGNDFTVNQSIMITAIGAFDNGGAMVASVPVAIYNMANNTIVSGTLVTLLQGTTGDFTANGSAFMNIAPVTLGPGTYSIVAANYGQDGEPYWWNHSPQGTEPGFNDGGGLITLGGGRYASPNTGLTFPGHTVGLTPGIPTYAAGTFEFTPVPETAVFATASVALLGLVYIGRYTVRKQKQA
jgi:hypothetical protein